MYQKKAGGKYKWSGKLLQKCYIGEYFDIVDYSYLESKGAALSPIFLTHALLNSSFEFSSLFLTFVSVVIETLQKLSQISIN